MSLGFLNSKASQMNDELKSVAHLVTDDSYDFEMEWIFQSLKLVKSNYFYVLYYNTLFIRFLILISTRLFASSQCLLSVIFCAYDKLNVK